MTVAEPTVKDLNAAYSGEEGWPGDKASKAEKLAFAQKHAELSEQAAAPKESKKESGHHLLTDSIHYQDDGGAWHEHYATDGPVKLTADEAKRLEGLGAVTKDADEAAEYRRLREYAAANAAPAGSVPLQQLG